MIVWLGTPTGPAFVGKAEIVTSSAMHDEMIAQIPEKYSLARIGRLFGLNQGYRGYRELRSVSRGADVTDRL